MLRLVCVKTSFVLAESDVHNIISELGKLIKSENFKKLALLPWNTYTWANLTP